MNNLKLFIGKVVRLAAKQVITLYLLPCKCNVNLFYFVKGTFFSTGSEHLWKTVKFIKRNGMPTDSIVIDVGGANGGTSQYFSTHLSPARVYCVEPNFRMFPLLDQLSATNSNITIKRSHLVELRGKQLYILPLTIGLLP